MFRTVRLTATFGDAEAAVVAPEAEVSDSEYACIYVDGQPVLVEPAERTVVYTVR